MQDIYDKTEDNKQPFKRFMEKKFEKSKIFSGLPQTPIKKGVRRMSIGDFQTLENTNKNNNNEQIKQNEINFYNTNNQT